MEKRAQIISLPRFLDDRGNLSFVENDNRIPFEIKRMHRIYDVLVMKAEVVKEDVSVLK